MLISLQIKDYALIENIQVEFGKGLNIITGETGAGKSILIDAMGLLLGERASNEVIRKGASKSFVEGIFEVDGNKKVKQLLDENEIEQRPELIVRREISAKGSNRCFLNDTPVTLNVIKDVGNLLVDLHGQHEHQSLLRSEMHIEMLDEISGVDDLLDSYIKSKNELEDKLHELKDLKEKENIIKEKKDIYAFQIKEIDAVSPEPDEDTKLEEELNILENSEKLLELTTNIYSGLYEGENSVYDNLVSIKNQLDELADIDKSFAEKTAECESSLTLVNDIAEFIRSYKDKIELEPEHLETLRERISAINLLKKKYGGSLKTVLEHRAKIGDEFDLAENFSSRITEVNKHITKLREECGTIAKKISAKRKDSSKKIKKQVEESLKYLGIENANFQIRFDINKADSSSENYLIVDGTKIKFNGRGIDEVEFFVSANIGEDPKPLVKVASGGEVSRIMLALKSVLAKSDRLPLLIFDEIDTGVSGRIAQKVGQALVSLSECHQIIAITHLPQIAALADNHYAVEKETLKDRVVSSIRLLADDERVREVAKLLSGEEVTETSIQSAKELMGQ